jgi:hypothetical protein
MAEYASRDSVILATGYLAEQRWQGLGPTLHRYATAVEGTAVPPIVEYLCPQVSAMDAQRIAHALLVTYSDQCGTGPQPTHVFRRYYRYLHWSSLAPVVDSVRADVLAPGPVE